MRLEIVLSVERSTIRLLALFRVSCIDNVWRINDFRRVGCVGPGGRGQV